MGKIIYAVIDSKNVRNVVADLTSKHPGILGASLYAVTFRDISIVASDFTYSKDCISKELALDFAAIIDAFAKEVTLLPIRFGTFLKSDEFVNQLLEKHYDSFFTNLQRVENKYEFGLKVMWDYEKGIQQIKKVTESEEIVANEYFAKNTVHTNYLFEKMKKHRLEDNLLKHVENLIEEICCHLKEINPECIFKKMINNSLIIDASFLVDKNSMQKFVQSVGELNGLQPELNFLLTGPWPPYSFVDIRIE